jgi:large subunit ribosomal protein L23
MDKTITLRPRLSEKTYGLSESRVYVLEVPAGVNKHSVARAVEAQFEVKVAKVNIANIRGKSKRIMSLTGKRVKNAEGRRNDIKKAYITLAEGHSLPFFNAIEEEESKEQELQEKVDKAATKQAAKESKPGRRGFRLPKKAKAEAEEETE